ncbi:MAG: cell envelope-related transcriptional attenuator [uncultured bacterium]|nr:MAG: cell envelope-related transcriptional attenuator [uncultured bacterium]
MDIIKKENRTNHISKDMSRMGDVRRPILNIAPLAENPKKPIVKKIVYNFFLWLFSFFILYGIFYGGFFIYKTYSIGKKMNPEIHPSSSILNAIKSIANQNLPPIKGNDDDQINILLLGTAGKGKPGQNLTDTLMVASIDAKTNRVALLSVPRDLYVPVPDAKINTKINSVYQYGLSSSGNDEKKAAEVIQKTIEHVTGFSIDYYIILNFDGFQKAIDDIGGINVISERDIYDERYPGPNYSYETFKLSKGFNHLDGATALKYARERHDDPEGDFGRAKRQQQIMQAAKNKVFSANTLMNVFTLNDLFNTLGDNIKTNIDVEEFPGFFELAKKLDTNNINNVVVDAWNKDSLLKVSHVQYGDIRAFVLIPRVGNYSEIHDVAKNIFDLNTIKRRKEEIAKENAKLVIINQSGDFHIISKIKKVLQDNLNYKNVELISDPAKKIIEHTLVYDSTDGQKPFTLDELAVKLPADVSYDMDKDYSKILGKKEFDMTIVIGKDLVERYNMEEATLDELNAAQDDQMYINLLDK